ncbi:sel1 repeat family protein [Candidatus Parcubacteria bacterium]|nr:MAG: sel1 repeat family protein [Candidatus Parcubacteria bacterium]
MMHFTGKIVGGKVLIEKNQSKAARLLEKALSSKESESLFIVRTGVPQEILGKAYLAGVGNLQRDDAKAERWLLEASAHGRVDATAQLGFRYLGVVESDIPVNIEKGIEFVRKAAEAGHAQAQMLMGSLYSVGTPPLFKSGVLAADWYYRAGVSFLKMGKKDMALACVQGIQELSSKQGLSVPNGFLADKLLKMIYIGSTQ